MWATAREENSASLPQQEAAAAIKRKFIVDFLNNLVELQTYCFKSTSPHSARVILWLDKLAKAGRFGWNAPVLTNTCWDATGAVGISGTASFWSHAQGLIISHSFYVSLRTFWVCFFFLPVSHHYSLAYFSQHNDALSITFAHSCRRRYRITCVSTTSAADWWSRAPFPALLTVFWPNLQAKGCAPVSQRRQVWSVQATFIERSGNYRICLSIKIFLQL